MTDNSAAMEGCRPLAEDADSHRSCDGTFKTIINRFVRYCMKES